MSHKERTKQVSEIEWKPKPTSGQKLNDPTTGALDTLNQALKKDDEKSEKTIRKCGGCGREVFDYE